MKPRLLLLEDEPASCEFLAAAAAALPADVDTAASVAEARRLAQAGEHALWLFDVNLPDGSGTGLLAQLRAQGLQVPALAHTAAQDADERERLLVAGFSAVIVKPLSAAAWQASIRAALHGQAGRAAPAASPAVDLASLTSLPVWDDAAAATALGGDPGNVAALRQLFLAELPGARHSVAAIGTDGEAARGMLHKLRAGCGFVGAARLQAAVAALQAAPDDAQALQAFLSAADATLG